MSNREVTQPLFTKRRAIKQHKDLLLDKRYKSKKEITSKKQLKSKLEQQESKEEVNEFLKESY